MKISKKMIQSGIVAVVTLVVAVCAVWGTNDIADNETVQVAETDSNDVFDDVENIATITANEAVVVSATDDDKKDEAEENEAAEQAEESATEEVVEEPEVIENEWTNRLMPNVEESLNVRTQPDENAELAGKLYKGSAAQIVEIGDGWTHITSGNVDGYVKNEYCVFGAEAESLAAQQCTTYATALTGALRIRTETNTEATVLDIVAEGDRLVVDTSAAPVEGWTAIIYDDQTAFVSAEYVSVEMEVGEGVTMEEEQARIAAEEAAKAAEEAAKAAAAQSTSTSTVQNAAVAANADETTILAAIIQIEAGVSSYDGQVAVGAVVMNRLRSGYASSITGVVYQSGQFATSRMDSVIANGVASSCYSAAQAAISGVDNTGGALSFRAASSGYAGTVIGNNVFF